MLSAKVHSIETMGLVDGPGIRTVVFLQGCPLKCTYCHNPDSQKCFSGKSMTADEIVKLAKRYKPYYDRTGGGVTLSGGEPLLQGEFLVEAVKRLKESGYHVALDTSGFGNEKYFDDILKHVDVLLLDIKHYENEGYEKITGRKISGLLRFMGHLNKFKGKIWIRHVMVPGHTDNDESVAGIFKFISHLSNKIEKIEVLPYHKLGIEKYYQLNLEDPLKGVPEMDKQAAKGYENHLMQMLADEKAKHSRHSKRAV